MFSPLDISLCCAVRSMLRVYSLNVPQNSQRYKICNVFRLFSFLSFHQLVLTIAIYLYVHAALITAQKFTVLSHWCVFTMYVVLWKKKKKYFVKFDISFCFSLCRCRRCWLCLRFVPWKKRLGLFFMFSVYIHQFEQTSLRTCTRIFETLSLEHSSRAVMRR